MSFGAGDDSFQPFDDFPGSADVWLYEIPILLRAKAMRPGNRPEFLCAGPIWLRRPESRLRGVNGLPSTANQPFNPVSFDRETPAPQSRNPRTREAPN